MKTKGVEPREGIGIEPLISTQILSAQIIMGKNDFYSKLLTNDFILCLERVESG